MAVPLAVIALKFRGVGEGYANTPRMSRLEGSEKAMHDRFRKLGSAAVPSALESLDDRVLAGLARRKSEMAANRRLMAIAGVFSLTGGIVAGTFAPVSATASTLTPLAPASPLDSIILSDDR